MLSIWTRIKICHMIKELKNIMGKGENSGYQLFLPYPDVFYRHLPPRVAKSQDIVVKGKIINLEEVER